MSLEAKLVDALNSNNRQKLESIFKKIYDSYFKLVYFCVSSYINIKEDIEDIVSDTFLSFYNHLDSIDASRSIKYYLTTTAKNKAINFIKKKFDLKTTNTVFGIVCAIPLVIIPFIQNYLSIYMLIFVFGSLAHCDDPGKIQDAHLIWWINPPNPAD